MSSSASVPPTVLVVDDERDVADAHALKLRDRYETRVAYGGQEALDAMDADVDAVLLDRRMPNVHGDTVLERIREEGYPCKVVLTTAVDPDLNILEMEFDDYLCKPISRETLLEALDQQLEPERAHDPRLDEFFQIVSKIEILEDELTPRKRRESDEYVRLKTRAEELGRELDDSMPEFAELVETFRDIDRSSV